MRYEVAFKLDKELDYYIDLIKSKKGKLIGNVRTHDIYYTNKNLRGLSEKEMKDASLRLRNVLKVGKFYCGEESRFALQNMKVFGKCLDLENELLEKDKVDDILYLVEKDGFKKVFDTVKYDYQFRIGDSSVIQIQAIEDIGIVLYYDNPKYDSLSLDEQREKLILELDTYGFNFAKDSKNVDKLRSLYYGRLMFS